VIKPRRLKQHLLPSAGYLCFVADTCKFWFALLHTTRLRNLFCGNLMVELRKLVVENKMNGLLALPGDSFSADFRDPADLPGCCLWQRLDWLAMQKGSSAAQQ